jgi:hypothetical protein
VTDDVTISAVEIREGLEETLVEIGMAAASPMMAGMARRLPVERLAPLFAKIMADVERFGDDLDAFARHFADSLRVRVPTLLAGTERRHGRPRVCLRRARPIRSPLPAR